MFFKADKTMPKLYNFYKKLGVFGFIINWLYVNLMFYFIGIFFNALDL